MFCLSCDTHVCAYAHYICTALLFPKSCKRGGHHAVHKTIRIGVITDRTCILLCLVSCRRPLPAHVPAAGPHEEVGSRQDCQRGLCGPHLGRDPAGRHQQREGLQRPQGLRPEQAGQHPHYALPGQETRRYAMHLERLLHQESEKL